MSRTWLPSSRSFAAVPPVETISTPCRASPAASSSRPLLSESDIKARLTGTRSVIFILGLEIASPLPWGGRRRKFQSARAAELPADFATECGDFADDDKLHRRLRLAATVDPQAFLGGQHPAAAAKVPWRRSLRAEDRAHAVGGGGDLDPWSKVKADGIGSRFADLLAALGN